MVMVYNYEHYHNNYYDYIVSISVHLEERNMHVVVKYYQSLCVLIIGTFSINSQAVYYLVNTVLNNQDSEYHSDNCEALYTVLTR